MIRRLYIKWLVWRGKAIDIWSKSPYPANVLSNLHPNAFELDGIKCASMEGFLQSLKYEDVEVQKEICALSGMEAKERSTSGWQTSQTVYWQGNSIRRQSQQFQDLIERSYFQLYQQNETFRKALLSTKGKNLYHTRGINNPYKTILTEKEFCTILTKLRDS